MLSPSYQLYLTPELVQALERSAKVATELHDEFVSTEHLFVAILDVPGLGARDSSAASASRASRSCARSKRAALAKSSSRDRESKEIPRAPEVHALADQDAALENKLDPVIGRDEEIKRVIQILSRRTKNNPILIGEAGVGKTAIAEGLAQRIAMGDVPESLARQRPGSLDLGFAYRRHQISRRVRRAPQSHHERN